MQTSTFKFVSNIFKYFIKIDRKSLIYFIVFLLEGHPQLNTQQNKDIKTIFYQCDMLNHVFTVKEIHHFN